MKPNFVVIGAPKAATTTLCVLLDEHPEVFMFPAKTTQFFNRRYDFGWAWYESLFEQAGEAKAIGEGSANYTVDRGDPPVAERMASHLPDARLIYIVRHPLERLESHYVQQWDNGHRFPSFGEAVRTWPPLMNASRYWERVNDYREHYPDEQILVLFFEDFKIDPQAELRRCFEFLGVDSSFKVSDPSTAKNTRADKRTDRVMMRWIRKYPAYVKLSWALPRWLKEKLKPVLRRKIKVEIEWDVATRQWVIDEIAADSRKFLEFYGKPAEYWRFE